jgi:hypothetical protein
MTILLPQWTQTRVKSTYAAWSTTWSWEREIPPRRMVHKISTHWLSPCLPNSLLLSLRHAASPEWLANKNSSPPKRCCCWGPQSVAPTKEDIRPFSSRGWGSICHCSLGLKRFSYSLKLRLEGHSITGFLLYRGLACLSTGKSLLGFTNVARYLRTEVCTYKLFSKQKASTWPNCWDPVNTEANWPWRLRSTTYVKCEWTINKN